jgi:hypothetical protein
LPNEINKEAPQLKVHMTIVRPSFNFLTKDDLDSIISSEKDFVPILIKAATFIDELARQLGLPRRTVATARFYLFRFYIHKTSSFKEYPPNDVAMCALLIAGKAEETFVSIKRILNAAILALSPSTGTTGGKSPAPHASSNASPTDSISTEKFNEWRQVVISYESDILEALNFNFCPPEYFSPLIRLGKMMGERRATLEKAWKTLDQMTLHPLILLRFPTYYLISAAILEARILEGRRRDKLFPPPLNRILQTKYLEEILSLLKNVNK